MLSQNQLKHLRALGVKKYRQEHGKFIVEGEKMVGELLTQVRIPVSAIFALEAWLEKNTRLLRQYAGKITPVTPSELSKISNLNTPNQVLAIAEIPAESLDLPLAVKELCFYLDGIQDPGNMGSILRIADWFGLPVVFCSPDCVEVYSPKVVQASMGSIFRIKSLEIPLPEILSASPSIAVAGAVLNGANVFATDLPKTGLIVIGNEGNGISPAIQNLLTHRVSILRHPTGSAESLNAAVAAGILAAAFRR